MGFAEAFKTQPLLIVPFGSVRKEILDFLQIELARRLGILVRVAGIKPIPKNVYNPKRRQYHSTMLLSSLKGMRIKKGRILGVVDVDLYVPELNFVFGEASIRDKVCIISLVRLRQEYYGLPKNESLFLSRTLKEAIHELGHTYQLSHCQNPKCIMHFSNSLRDTDIKEPGFCNTCKLKLR
ncbi:MAG: archaemetzincin family Zn-dependent metalloprotease [Planctomycetota bacterium]|jgi:archaemetzincin